MVGVTAALYHGASGRWRTVLRKLDYWSISYASSVLRSAAGVQLPRALQAMSYMLMPIKPTVTTAANLALVEVRLHLPHVFVCELELELPMHATGKTFLVSRILHAESSEPIGTTAAITTATT